MDGYFSRRRGSFKAYLTIQANPSATITATGDRATYSGVADNGTGLVMLEIKKKGVYTLTTSNNANTNAGTSSNGTTVNNSGSTVTAPSAAQTNVLVQFVSWFLGLFGF